MKRFHTILITVLTLMLVLTGCASRPVQTSRTIAVTIRPLALIAQAIAGPELTIETLADDAGSPLENAAVLASGSAVVFRTGTAIDTWSSQDVTGNGRLIELSSALDRSTADGAWLSFRDSVDMARLMRDTLDTLYPESRQTFDSNYATLVNQCSQADGRLKQLIWKASTRAFIAADTVWSGAARDFGLRIIVQSALKNMDLAAPGATSKIMAWGSGEKTGVVVMNTSQGTSSGIDRRQNGLTICRLDPLGANAGDTFVPWLESRLTLLGSALGT